MEGSGETESNSKTSPCNKDDVKDEISDEHEEKNESCNFKNGGSSSNSTVEESGDKKPFVRPYVRSKMPRLRWTADLHLRFMQAVERLGGQERATPKLVLQLMNVKGLNIAHVKSHLQMFRSKKISDETNYCQGLSDHRSFMGGVDRNMYNLGQLPLLPSFIQAHHSRYGNASWINDHGKWMHNSTMEQNTSYNKIKPVICGSVTENILDSHYYKSATNLDPCSRIYSSISQDEFRSLHKQDPAKVQSNQNPNTNDQLHPRRVYDQHGISLQLSKSTNCSWLKRKASNNELDLNLSLGLEHSRSHDQKSLLKEDENLWLSLYTISSSSKKMKEDDVKSSESARGASTLGLTL